ncbi:uncharacterized protein LOC106073220 isoform X2 [Biomphalaria glabrata]|uniref:Uncharacterized protein LOC106073220 isoform X2 n=1 Tax=Biomphalaria glabrata TaxID=6526 RepID=A0A9W2YTA3_BIOGL|nr:uncharacterized protein LOC106073220 isoform X2 [Biomphalaria glabrata]
MRTMSIKCVFFKFYASYVWIILCLKVYCKQSTDINLRYFEGETFNITCDIRNFTKLPESDNLTSLVFHAQNVPQGNFLFASYWPFGSSKNGTDKPKQWIVYYSGGNSPTNRETIQITVTVVSFQSYNAGSYGCIAEVPGYSTVFESVPVNITIKENIKEFFNEPIEDIVNSTDGTMNLPSNDSHIEFFNESMDDILGSTDVTMNLPSNDSHIGISHTNMTILVSVMAIFFVIIIIFITWFKRKHIAQLLKLQINQEALELVGTVDNCETADNYANTTVKTIAETSSGGQDVVQMTDKPIEVESHTPENSNQSMKRKRLNYIDVQINQETKLPELVKEVRLKGKSHTVRYTIIDPEATLRMAVEARLQSSQTDEDDHESQLYCNFSSLCATSGGSRASVSAEDQVNVYYNCQMIVAESRETTMKKEQDRSSAETLQECWDSNTSGVETASEWNGSETENNENIDNNPQSNTDGLYANNGDTQKMSAITDMLFTNL